MSDIDKANPAVPIILDKPRHLLFDLNGMIAFKNETGINVLGGEAVEVLTKEWSPEVMRAFFWACLIHEDENLTLFEAGKFIHMVNLEEIVDKLQLAWSAAVPDVAKGDAPPLPRRARRHPQRG